VVGIRPVSSVREINKMSRKARNRERERKLNERQSSPKGKRRKKYEKMARSGTIGRNERTRNRRKKREEPSQTPEPNSIRNTIEPLESPQPQHASRIYERPTPKNEGPYSWVGNPNIDKMVKSERFTAAPAWEGDKSTVVYCNFGKETRIRGVTFNSMTRTYTYESSSLDPYYGTVGVLAELEDYAIEGAGEEILSEAKEIYELLEFRRNGLREMGLRG